MQNSVKDRVRKLRQEIGDISAASRRHIESKSKDYIASSDQARRLQRLQEIMDELRSLTDWKQT